MRRALFARFGRDRRGVAAVEFAFVLPLLLVLLAGALETRRLWQASRAINTLAAQAALVIADCAATPPATCANDVQRMLAAVGTLAPHLDRTQLTMEAVEIARTAGVAQFVSGSAALAGALAPNVLALFRDGQTAVIVRVRYTHMPTVFRNFLPDAVPEILRFDITASALKG
jgi:Flp pilus assembly protein TadG